MTRTFLHSFDPPTASPAAGPTVDLEVMQALVHEPADDR